MQCKNGEVKRIKRLWYLSHRRPAKAQASLGIPRRVRPKVVPNLRVEVMMTDCLEEHYPEYPGWERLGNCIYSGI